MALYNAFKWVRAVWCQMNIQAGILLHLLCFAKCYSLPERWHTESCSDNWDDSFQWDSAATGSNQYLKPPSAEQTNLARTLARSITLCGALLTRVLWVPKHAYLKPALESPSSMSHVVKQEQGWSAHCGWNLPSTHSSALSSSFLFACFVLALALPCPQSELIQLDNLAENQYRRKK